MAVLHHYELARSGEFRFGEAPGLERRFVCVVDNPGATTFGQCAIAIGVDIGSFHPEYTRVPCTSAEVVEGYEGSRYHVEVVYRYEVNEDLVENINPLNRADKWRFETGGVTVPALYHFTGAGNGTSDLRPLTNSAFDYFEGLSVDEAQSQAVITGNRPTFPSSLAVALTNTINVSSYLGGAAHTWKCAGIAATRESKLVGTQVVNYWSFTTTLIYRQTGWNLLLPDMGFNALVGGQKRRVMTFDFENSEWVASPVPMGLDGLGAQTFGAPAILTRRVYRHVDFNIYFGTPPP
jgi:hypothetical protein